MNREQQRKNFQEFVADEASVDNDNEYESQDEAKAEIIREMYRPRNNRYNDFLNRDAQEIAQEFVDQERIERVTKKNMVHQVPTLKDPKLFAVKCLIGAEREMALSVGNKYNALKGTADEIRIISVSALDKIQGYIYVEAINKFDAETACRGFNKLRTRFINVGLTRWSIPRRSMRSSSRIPGTARRSGNTISSGSKEARMRAIWDSFRRLIRIRRMWWCMWCPGYGPGKRGNPKNPLMILEMRL